MNSISIAKFLFIFSNLLLMIATNRSITTPFYIDYFIKIILVLILFRESNRDQLRYFLLVLIMGTSEVLLFHIYLIHIIQISW